MTQEYWRQIMGQRGQETPAWMQRESTPVQPTDMERRAMMDAYQRAMTTQGNQAPLNQALGSRPAPPMAAPQGGSKGMGWSDYIMNPLGSLMLMGKGAKWLKNKVF